MGIYSMVKCTHNLVVSYQEDLNVQRDYEYWYYHFEKIKWDEIEYSIRI